ncbi:MAG: alcohol dehydrogenase catalytic domain-containing protein [Clostridiaceae bacterium]|nr:alcohol dehydrogenase catalytic domain-containing protein [Clostridiaceae bacterium]
MKALVYKGKGTISLEDRQVPSICDERDAIVEITLSTICSSDIHIMHGQVELAKEGIVLGHEMVGKVAEIGPLVKNVSVGDRVIVNVETFCGECFYCKRGYVNNCDSPDGGWSIGCKIDGGQAGYIRIPLADNNLKIIPEGVSYEQALLVGDVLSTGWWAAELGELNPGDYAVVLGAGPTGLCTMKCAQLYTPLKVIAVDVINERLEFALSNGYADIVLNPLEVDNLEATVKELTAGRGADVVFEAAGGKDTFEQAWRIARPSGIVVIIAAYEDDPQYLPLRTMYGKNLTFKTGGVHANSCDVLLDLISSGKLDVSDLITKTVPLNDIIEAYDAFEHNKKDIIKIAITPYEYDE